MIQTLLRLEEHQNRVLNVVKGKLGFKNKNDAIRYVIDEYEENHLEPELRPEYIKKALKIHNEPSIKIGNLENLRKRYEK